jgi:hypothetical protein
MLITGTCMVSYFLGLVATFMLLTLANLTSAQAGVLAIPNVSGNVDLSKVLQEEIKKYHMFDQSLLDALTDMSELSPSKEKNKSFETDFERIDAQLNEIKTSLLESRLRIEFLNNFISGLDHVSDVRTSAPPLLVRLAHRQINGAIENDNEPGPLWRFEIYFAIAIKDCLEPNENFSDFISSYFLKSSMKDPTPPQDFCNSRKYIGQKTTNPEVLTQKSLKDSAVLTSSPQRDPGAYSESK